MPRSTPVICVCDHAGGTLCAIRGNDKNLGEMPWGWVRTLAFAAGVVAAANVASAQTGFPTKAVHLFVPYPAGGAVDILARTLGDELSKNWGQPVIVENRPGRRRPGRFAGARHLGAGRLHADRGRQRSRHQSVPLSEDPLRHLQGFHADLACWRRRRTSCWCARTRRYKTLADLLAQARAKPGSLSYGMAGNGTSTHLAGELLKNLAKVDIVAIPYKGGGPAMNDLLGGQIPMSFNNGPESVGQISAGTVRALGVTTAKRAPFLPDVPTMAEAGVPGYDTGVWWGLVGPAGMPATIVGAIVERFRRRTEGAGGEGPAQHARRDADRQFAEGIRRGDPRRLREVGPDHQGRGNEGRMTRRTIDDSRLPAAARADPAEGAAAAERLRYPRACVRAGGAVSLRRRPQLHAAGRAAGKISGDARRGRLSIAACWCRAARMAATIRRCWMRWRASRIACAASRWPMKRFVRNVAAVE